MSRLQTKLAVDQLPPYEVQSPLQAILRRRLLTQHVRPCDFSGCNLTYCGRKIAQRNLRSIILGAGRDPVASTSKPVTPFTIPHSASPNTGTIDALYAIQTTPYGNSFLSRLQGAQSAQTRGCLAVDWENRTPWMDLMQDIRDHFFFLQ